ncbi:ArsR/SmtB family transcription factor [Kitasatospora sp. NPDC088391]|uniref:ArsR/SmtB family transcription factor n=1 Tax=Kitasatospora sp. NPDC088391 TaxID=3364074 RepID=UPI0038016631
MLRIHFTAQDLVRVDLIEPLPEISEAVLSLQVARRTDQEVRFGAWRTGLRTQLPAGVGPLLDLVPARGWIPDFLTPTTNPGEPAAALEDVRATPRHRLAADLGRFAGARPLPDWVSSLGHGDPGAMDVVVRALGAYHAAVIAPRVRALQGVLDAELARRTTSLYRRGIGGLLGGLHPALLWRPPVLTVPARADADVHLAGRGLMLAPMLFCGPLPRLVDGGADRVPVLCYPLPFDLAANPLSDASPAQQRQHASALGRLLGTTRAAALRAIASTPGLSTAELADRLAVSLASASEHATVLRRAGLTTTHRDGPRVRHHLTAAGATVLAAPIAAP